MKKLVIYGAGGLGREVLSMMGSTTEEFGVVGFLDDGIETSIEVNGLKILGGLEWLSSNHNCYVVLAAGNPKTKASILKQIKNEWHVKFTSIIHQRALIQNLNSVSIGEGSIIGAGSILTTDIAIGKHVLINLNATIGHDTRVGDCVSIMPGVNVAGNVAVGNEVLIGSGANILNNIKIGMQSTIGAGSVVNHDIPALSVAAGVPARVIK